MGGNIQFKLNTTSVLTIPFYAFDKDFCFIVNGEEFKTSRFIANFLSPKIGQMQLNDPTISHFYINTQNKGNFQHFLNLINFQKNVFPINEIPFIEEVTKILENESISFEHPKNSLKITQNDIFDQLNNHMQYPIVNSPLIQEEIELIASNFYNFDHEMLIEKLKSIKIEMIEKIFENSKLRLDTEDQLISIINDLYIKDSKFSILYQYVDFVNLSELKISEFLQIFNIDDLTNSIWHKISNRLIQKIFTIESIKENRYEKIDKVIDNIIIQIPHQSNEFDGIINFLNTNNKKLAKDIKITSSPIYNEHVESNVILYDDYEKGFATNGENAFICFNFGRIGFIPKSYTIRSWNSEKDSSHPKGWVLEGSNDNYEFDILDEQRNCSLLNGKSLTCTFNINNILNKKYQYLRMRSIMPDWNNGNQLDINSIDFNGGYIM